MEDNNKISEDKSIVPVDSQEGNLETAVSYSGNFSVCCMLEFKNGDVLLYILF